MATLPLIISLADSLDSLRNQFYDTDFGLGYHCPRHYMRLPSLPSGMLEQLKSPTKKDGGAVSTVGKDGFQACMNVQQFRPSELTVKTVDNYVIVEGKHEERQDDLGYISRHFVRKYALPDGYDPKHVVSSLSSDGVLTVSVPPPPKSTNSNERIVQIQQTGPAHLSVKDNPKDDKEAEAKK